MSAAAVPAGPARPPNILLVVLDCVRAKSVRGAGNGGAARTPAIDALARRGTYFPRAVAPSNWTVPSHMSLFTGTYPSAHGVRTFRSGPAPEETVATWMRAHGYATSLFSEMVHLVGGYGLEDGFDHREVRRAGVHDEERTVANRLAGHAQLLYSERVRRLIERLPPTVLPMNAFNHPQEVAFKDHVCGPHTVAAFDAWLATREASRPFFTFINLVDGHEPYPEVENGHRTGTFGRWYARTPRYYLLAVDGLQERVPWERLRAGYHASIEVADRKVGELVAALERHGELDRTMVVVTADHGQSFGEMGNVYHGCGATESITRVPLVVAPPAGLPVPSEVGRWTSLCELAAWFKSAATGRVPFDDDGVAPFPFGALAPDPSIVYCEGAPASDPNRSLRGIRPEQLWNHRLLAAYRGEEKFVLDQVTGRMFRWTGAGDFDARPPEELGPTDAHRLRALVFASYERWDEERRLTAPEGPGVETALDRRLRSWGYD